MTNTSPENCSQNDRAEKDFKSLLDRLSIIPQGDKLIEYYKNALSSPLPYNHIKVFIESWFHSTISTIPEELLEKVEKIRSFNDFYVALIDQKSFVSEANFLLTALAWDNIDHSLLEIMRYFKMTKNASPVAAPASKTNATTPQNKDTLKSNLAELKKFEGNFSMQGITVTQRTGVIRQLGKKAKDPVLLKHILETDALLCKVSKLSIGFKNKESKELLLSYAKKYPGAYLKQHLLETYKKEFEEIEPKLAELDSVLSLIEQADNSTLKKTLNDFVQSTIRSNNLLQFPGKRFENSESRNKLVEQYENVRSGESQIQQLTKALIEAWFLDASTSEEDIGSQLKELSSITERRQFITEQIKKAKSYQLADERSNLKTALKEVDSLLDALNRNNIKATLDGIEKVIKDRNVEEVLSPQERGEKVEELSKMTFSFGNDLIPEREKALENLKEKVSKQGSGIKETIAHISLVDALLNKLSELYKTIVNNETIKFYIQKYQAAYTNDSLLTGYKNEFEEQKTKLEKLDLKDMSTETSQQADVILPAENEKLIKLIEHLQFNMRNKINRWTSGEGSSKYKTLDNKRNMLLKGEPIDFDAELKGIETICQEKRNPRLHFWQPAESVGECSRFIKENNLRMSK